MSNLAFQTSIDCSDMKGTSSITPVVTTSNNAKAVKTCSWPSTYAGGTYWVNANGYAPTTSGGSTYFSCSASYLVKASGTSTASPTTSPTPTTGVSGGSSSLYVDAFYPPGGNSVSTSTSMRYDIMIRNNGAATSPDFTISIDWGDGTTYSGSGPSLTPGNYFNTQLYHSFYTPGSYTKTDCQLNAGTYNSYCRQSP